MEQLWQFKGNTGEPAWHKKEQNQRNMAAIFTQFLGKQSWLVC